MKYLPPLVMLASAAWATQSAPRGSAAPGLQEPGERRAREEVPWLNPALAAEVAAVLEGDPHSEAQGGGEPHAGLHGHGGPHESSYADGELTGSCPHLASEVAGAGELPLADPHAGLPHDADPHASVRAPSRAEPAPHGVPRSSARNGHTIEELYAKRGALAGQAVRVRGVVVKRTDGILGQSYVHLRDGTGSVAGQDHDLTVTTVEEVAIGETVELQGLLRLDQDLGLGYRYALLLTGATHAEVR